MNPYTVLGVAADATSKEINQAYRKKAKGAHPDQGGDPEKFIELGNALLLLMDPKRRERYDTTGRWDVSKVTPERIKQFVDQTIQNVVNHQGVDNLSRDNVRDKILVSVIRARNELYNMKQGTQRKMARAEEMLCRFHPNEGEVDHVGNALRAELSRLQEEMNSHEDAMEMSQEVERLFKSYGYEVGPEPEGQASSRPSPIRRNYFSGDQS